MKTLGKDLFHGLNIMRKHFRENNHDVINNGCVIFGNDDNSFCGMGLDETSNILSICVCDVNGNNNRCFRSPLDGGKWECFKVLKGYRI